MIDPAHPIAKLLREDRRYTLDAYVFLFEALQYAQNVLHMGADSPSEASDKPASRRSPRRAKRGEGGETTDDLTAESEQQRHVTGQQLCEAIRRYALEQFGFMAKTVLNSWGVRSTGDFGEIVFNLIRIGRMRKTRHDRREDFNNVYDFETAFQEFKITME